MIFPIKVVDINVERFNILNENNTVKAGGTLKHEVEYCKYVDMPSSISRQFINGLIFSMPESIVNNPTGCNKIIANTIVPHELPTGKYFLRTVVRYDLNPIRSFSVTIDTEEFTVIE
jgi:hypothetical protein